MQRIMDDKEHCQWYWHGLQQAPLLASPSLQRLGAQELGHQHSCYGRDGDAPTNVITQKSASRMIPNKRATACRLLPARQATLVVVHVCPLAVLHASTRAKPLYTGSCSGPIESWVAVRRAWRGPGQPINKITW